MFPDFFHVIELGKYFYGKPRQLPESCNFTYTRTAHYLLLLIYKSPRPDEIRNIEKGKIRLAFLAYKGIIFFLCKFGDEPWSDSSFNFWSVPPRNRTIPELLTLPEYRIPLKIILLDAKDGKVIAMRLYTPSPYFSQQLARAIYLQSQHEPIDKQTYNDIIKECYSKYPQTSEMLDDAIHDVC